MVLNTTFTTQTTTITPAKNHVLHHAFSQKPLKNATKHHTDFFPATIENPRKKSR
ncbi:hypothetical protein HDF10_002774 [Edaphobacter lichenicola]|uniref:Uncharacterized protein n=1 Tax=Tunturiibacter lichenicola TaxID=2051959 RepID=A0A7W8J973_9BACT|nr:hypothetical protein [Edaphobacter lichenicola]